MVKVLAYYSRGREFNSRPSRCQVTTLGKLFAHMCLCHQAVQYGTSREAAIEVLRQGGNRRSGAALAMRHRLKWFRLSICGLKA